MNKQELIDELKKEIEATKNVSNFEEHVNLYGKGKRVGLEFGWMLAEKLDEPEITEEQAWEVIRGNPEIKEFVEILADQMKYRALERKIKLLTNLDMDDFIEELTKNGLNKNKLVEVPQFVDDWIRGIKSGEISESGTGEEDLIFEICQQYYEETLPEELSKWFSHNVDSYIFYRAVLDGYTIEPPKTLQVIVKNYDSTVYKTELPEDEAMKLIEGWKG